MPVLLLLHLPPAFPSLVNRVVDPLHTVVLPLIIPALAAALTVKVLDDEKLPPQVELMLYVIFVVPAVNVVTNPEASTVAIVVLLLLQIPPVLPSLV